MSLMGLLIVVLLPIFTSGCGRYGSPTREERASSPRIDNTLTKAPSTPTIQETINPDTGFDDGDPK